MRAQVGARDWRDARHKALSWGSHSSPVGGTFRTWRDVRLESEMTAKADVRRSLSSCRAACDDTAWL
jgi:hypothetical protein